jgi:Cu/Ag efflux pump CusA
VTLFGITLRNSIMLISHYEHLVKVEGMTWKVNTALRGASERLAPILIRPWLPAWVCCHWLSVVATQGAK